MKEDEREGDDSNLNSFDINQEYFNPKIFINEDMISESDNTSVHVAAGGEIMTESLATGVSIGEASFMPPAENRLRLNGEINGASSIDTQVSVITAVGRFVTNSAPLLIRSKTAS